MFVPYNLRMNSEMGMSVASTTKNFVCVVRTCFMLQLFWPSSGIKYM